MSGFIHNGKFLKAKISIDNYISKTKLFLKKMRCTENVNLLFDIHSLTEQTLLPAV